VKVFAAYFILSLFLLWYPVLLRKSLVFIIKN